MSVHSLLCCVGGGHDQWEGSIQSEGGLRTSMCSHPPWTDRGGGGRSPGETLLTGDHFKPLFFVIYLQKSLFNNNKQIWSTVVPVLKAGLETQIVATSIRNPFAAPCI